MDTATNGSAKGGSPGTLICWPGAEATAGLLGVELEDAHLMMLLDPLAMALTLPPEQAGWPPMARFLRELADSATLLADQIDPDGRMQPRWAGSGQAGSTRRVREYIAAESTTGPTP